MINFKKEKLIKKHLGIATPDWIVQNCIKMLNEFEALTIPVVGSAFYCENQKMVFRDEICLKQCDNCREICR